MTFRPKSATMLGPSRFRWSEHAPHPALAAWVSSHWSLEAGPGPHVVRTLPDACVDLTLRFDGAPQAHLAGAHRRSRTWEFSGPMTLVGSRLLPGAVALLGIDASELTDGWTPLSRFVKRRAVSALLRRAARASTLERRVLALEAFLTESLVNRSLEPRLSRAIAYVFAREGDVTVAAIAKVSGAHARTLRRLFDAAVGLSPKRFARVVRLQAALRALPERPNWAAVAADLGYHDQAHFIHDVRELFGATPKALVAVAERTR